MESINANINRFEKNDITINVLSFDIYNDTNYWDSNILNESRNLYFDLIISSTDLYNSIDLKCYWFYDDSDFTLAQLQTKFNNSEFLYDINQCTFNNKLSYLNISTNNNYIFSQSNYEVDYDVNWNSTKNVYMYLYYNDTYYDLWLDNASMNLTNISSTPFYSQVSNDGYQNGYNTGYQNGINANQQTIYEDGYQNGYNDGYQYGLNDNQETIYQNGYNTGYDLGYNGGYNVGYDKGHLDGIDDALSGDYDLSNMVVKVADTPINLFKSIFDIEFMGINLVPIIFGITALGIAVWLIRRFMGGD